MSWKVATIEICGNAWLQTPTGMTFDDDGEGNDDDNNDDDEGTGAILLFSVYMWHVWY